jgi:hypothetical protein
VSLSVLGEISRGAGEGVVDSCKKGRRFSIIKLRNETTSSTPQKMVATRRNKKQGTYQKGDKVEVSFASLPSLSSSVRRALSKADSSLLLWPRITTAVAGVGCVV